MFEAIPDVPEITKYMTGKGEISTRDNPELIAAVQDGYKVFTIVDASGRYSNIDILRLRLGETKE